MVSSDWASQAHNQKYYSASELTKVSQEISDSLQDGGKKKSTKKATKKRVEVKGKKRVVYEGKRGGEYIKEGGKFVSLKSCKDCK